MNLVSQVGKRNWLRVQFTGQRQHRRAVTRPWLGLFGIRNGFGVSSKNKDTYGNLLESVKSYYQIGGLAVPRFLLLQDGMILDST